MESYEYETDFSNLNPTAQQPASAQPAAEDHIADQPVTEQPIDGQPVVEQPVPERKISPFADSPYETYQPAVEAPQQVYAHPPVPKKAKKHRSNWLAIVAIVLVVCLTVTFTVFMVASNSKNAALSSQIAALQLQIKELQKEIKKNSYTGNGNSVSGTPSSGAGLTPGQVYAQNIDSVVLIYANTSGGRSTGSGFVLTEDGYVVTNYHVVEGGTTYTVVTSDGDEYAATLTGGDETNDVAVLKVDGVALDPVELGSSDDLIVGDQVVAIGNPLGELTSTLTVGYISGKNRDVSTDGTSINMLQTDASINSGNSGGPLFNMKGQVIGITTAKYSGNTSSGASIEGIGFAIPIDDVKGMLQEIMDNGYVSRPYMGVYIRDTAEGIGVYVESLEPLGPAYLAGMRSGDIIVQLGNSPVTSINSLSRALYAYKVGDTAKVTVYRNRQLLELTITFMEKPQTEN
jgi:S1-C subfamily serine protease